MKLPGVHGDVELGVPRLQWGEWLSGPPLLFWSATYFARITYVASYTTDRRGADPTPRSVGLSSLDWFERPA
jgi:hypothetical protein